MDGHGWAPYTSLIQSGMHAAAGLLNSLPCQLIGVSNCFERTVDSTGDDTTHICHKSYAKRFLRSFPYQLMAVSNCFEKTVDSTDDGTTGIHKSHSKQHAPAGGTPSPMGYSQLAAY